MHKFIARIARLAASKAAAFVYAVAVGVAGNLAFNFVQEHHHPIPGAVVPERAAVATELRTPMPPPAAHLREKAVAAAPIATAPILPDPPAVALPGADTLPTPTLKPAALRERVLKPAALPEEALKPAMAPEPALRPAALPEQALKPATPPIPLPPAALSTAAPDPAALRPHQETVLTTPEPAAKPTAEVATAPPAPASDTAATAAASEPLVVPAPLPPLGPAVDVSTPPEPPSEMDKVIAASRSARNEAAPTGETPAPSRKQKSWELSDIWHPGRAVQKGLHWAGDQLPIVGGADAQPRFPAVAPAPPSASPIPLLPPATRSNLSDSSSGLRAPGKPGPGSGGLY